MPHRPIAYLRKELHYVTKRNHMITNRAAIYARVSTFEQNTDLQLRDLREYCKPRGWTAVEYVDTGVSGAKSSREQLDRIARPLVQQKRSQREGPVTGRRPEDALSRKLN
ncbi:MAG: recombinase family protein [Bryobacteraceae bacterium]